MRYISTRGEAPSLGFIDVTLAGLGPTLSMVSILTVAGYFQLFAEPYVMTEGGPLRSTLSVLYLMFEQGFKWWNLGLASAVAFLLFGLVFLVTEVIVPGLVGIALLGDAVRPGWWPVMAIGLVSAVAGVVVLAHSPAQAPPRRRRVR